MDKIKKKYEVDELPSIKSTVFVCIFLIMASSITLFFYNKLAAIVFFILQIVGIILIVHSRQTMKKFVFDHFWNLSNQVKSISEYAVSELPIGILLYGKSFKIEWVNKYVTDNFSYTVKNGATIGHFSEKLQKALEANNNELPLLSANEMIFKVTHCPEQRLLYIIDITEKTVLENKYLSERPVVCMVFLDNFDDVVQGLDDQRIIQLQNLCISEILNWGKENNFLLRRIDSDRLIGFLNEQGLAQLEKKKFDILDTVREMTTKEGIPITISIGVGSGSESLTELSQLSQSSLDIALGRGGDQVVIRTPIGRARFYGGKSNPLGKRTRVRARVISNALSDLIVDSDHTIIMGHKIPDMDVYGSAIGLLEMVIANDRKGFIVREGINEAQEITNLFTMIEDNEMFKDVFITTEEAHNSITENTLLIIVDTHKPFLVIEKELLKEVSKVVVIDHHRRAEEMIQNPLLAYVEPYASSTAELVTELISYHSDLKKIDKITATALLSGIIVDTKSFTMRTGVRTFDAASYLRLQGADLEEIQKLFKENIDVYLERNKLIENHYFYHDGFVIAYAEEDYFYSQVQIAKSADMLLTLKSVNASFVVAKNKNKTVSISARSTGEINVQLIMESLGGGGHMNNAAVQIADKSVDEVLALLHEAIDIYIDGRERK